MDVVVIERNHDNMYVTIPCNMLTSPIAQMLKICSESVMVNLVSNTAIFQAELCFYAIFVMDCHKHDVAFEENSVQDTFSCCCLCKHKK